MKVFKTLFFIILAFIFTSVAWAQEGDLKELDSVIARINTDVILRSAYERELSALIEDLKQRGLKDEELEKKLNEIKPTIIDTLIDQQLLAQRAKELSIDVEPQINEQIVRMMKENNIHTIEELEQKMREVGIDLNEQKRLMRYKFLADAVMGREVYSEIYRRLTEQSKKDFYDAHKDLFSTPGEVELRRIFIQKGKNPLIQQQFLNKAKEIADQARGGTDFKNLVRSKSEDPAALITKEGYIGWVPIPDLSAEVRTAVEKAAAGTITDPILMKDGYAIYRVEGRKEPVVKPFENDDVKREVSNRLVMEKGQAEVEEYLKHLREDAFIEIDPRFQIPGLKTASANIKRTPYSEESDKEKKKRLKREKKEKEQQVKEPPKGKITAQK